MEGEGHQTGPQLRYAQSELCGRAISKVRRTELGKGQSDRWRLTSESQVRFPACVLSVKAVGFSHLRHVAVAADLRLRGTTLVEKHRDDRAGTAVAELLAELLFVVRNPVPFDQVDEVPRRVARQRRSAEVAVLRKEIFRPGMDIGEVAAAPARYRDFLAHPITVLQEGHSAPALPSRQCAHHPGRAATDDYDIEARGRFRSHRGSQREEDPWRGSDREFRAQRQTDPARLSDVHKADATLRG